MREEQKRRKEEKYIWPYCLINIIYIRLIKITLYGAEICTLWKFSKKTFTVRIIPYATFDNFSKSKILTLHLFT